MAILGRFVSAITAGLGAFQERMLDANPDPNRKPDSELWGRFDSRKIRYGINHGFFRNDVYRNFHAYAGPYKFQFGLYRHTAGFYNPAGRIIEFWSTHLWGGLLDMQAGDGSERATALPVADATPAFRKALGRLWVDSDWQVEKSTVTEWGPLYGTPAIRVVDDLANGLVYMQPVHPGTLRWVNFDSRRNVVGYVMEEQRQDPDQASPVVNPNVSDSTA
jgi:hypothetical protein